MSTEVELLKEKNDRIKTDCQDSYQREERVQRTNQNLKMQLDGSRKDQEKTLMQMKSLLAEKDRLTEEIYSKEETTEIEAEKLKQMELKLSTETIQKTQII